ncbi:MAG: exodeoxyribonuclease VII large subunit [Planctomycetota bacterium]|jgi:exodeoxyribonuclease VII large subunit
MAPKKKKLPIFTVSQLNNLIQVTLEEGLPSRMILRGEISNWKRHSSGHCYFSLKDPEGAQVPSVMWASKFRNIKFDCQNGLAILATGHVDVYIPGGKYQFYAEKLEPAGIGDLQLAFEQMRKRLQTEGLFDPAHKLALPAYPMNIGIVTSRSGAAVVDIADSIYSRWPCATLHVFDAPVQGEGAAEKIAVAINKANRMQKQLRLDTLIVGRGGGSMEDLWAFNEEPVARSIFASKIPVISAVGHEVDMTIADLVADARASTPTQAGVIAVPDYRDELGKLHSLKRRLHLNTRSTIQHSKNQLDTILASRVFRSPLGPLQVAAQRIDELVMALAGALKTRIMRTQSRLDRIREKLQKIEPTRLIASRFMAMSGYDSRNRVGIMKILSKNQLKLAALENRLAALDPRSVLNRGYSITMNERTGGVVAAIEDVQIGDPLRTELAKGQLHSRVEKVLRGPEK